MLAMIGCKIICQLKSRDYIASESLASHDPKTYPEAILSTRHNTLYLLDILDRENGF